MPRRVRSVLAAFLTLGIAVAAIAWHALRAESDERQEFAISGPRYWKGNLHTHSLWSDGDDFPEMIADWYKQHGYHFLGLSDHNVLSEGERWIHAAVDDARHGRAVKKYLDRFGPHWVERREQEQKPQVRLKPLAEFRSLLEEPGKFLLIQAEEVTGNYGKFPVHLNAINVRDVIAPTQGDSAAETVRVNLRAVMAQQQKVKRPMLGFVNHPNFGWGLKVEDLLGTDELGFFEIYNGHPSVANYGDDKHPGTERIWDILLALRLGKLGLPLVYGLATDDAHNYHDVSARRANPGRGWVMVQAPYLTAEAIVRGIESGNFYCSTGVTLHAINRAGKTISLAIRPEAGVTYRTQFITTLRDTAFTSGPRLGSDGRPVDGSRVYHDDIGQVIAEVDGVSPSYTMTGKELYVRAKVVSSKLHPNPYKKGDVEVAWTQPVAP